jgi:hypothetical protein
VQQKSLVRGNLLAHEHGLDRTVTGETIDILARRIL